MSKGHRLEKVSGRINKSWTETLKSLSSNSLAEQCYSLCGELFFILPLFSYCEVYFSLWVATFLYKLESFFFECFFFVEYISLCIIQNYLVKVSVISIFCIQHLLTFWNVCEAQVHSTRIEEIDFLLRKKSRANRFSWVHISTANPNCKNSGVDSQSSI